MLDLKLYIKKIHVILFFNFLDKTIGKALFKFGGRDAFCSASSSGNNAVLTAGHCLWMEGNFHTNFIFIPQYNDKNTPAGRYPANKLMIFVNKKKIKKNRKNGNNKIWEET
jgi:V8-like Glu-specific endopeptidase